MWQTLWPLNYPNQNPLLVQKSKKNILFYTLFIVTAV